MNTKVSIIVPVYNCENYIKRCLYSIIEQSYNDLEIIVINDGSIDNSEKIIKDISSVDNRIKYIIQENMGPSVARNNGIKESTGKYLVFIDGDDCVEEKYVEKLFLKADENNADLVCCGYIEKSNYGQIELNDFYENKNSLTREQVSIKVCNGLGGTLWGKIFKSEIIKKNNIHMKEDIFMCEDLIFVLEYCKYSKSFYAIEDKLYLYNRLNQNSITSMITKEYLSNNIKVYNILEVLLQNLDIESENIYKILRDRYEGLTKAIIKSEVKLNRGYKEYFIYKEDLKYLFSIDEIRKFKCDFSRKSVYEKFMYICINNNLFIFIYICESFCNMFNKIKKSIRGIKV